MSSPESTMGDHQDIKDAVELVFFCVPFEEHDIVDMPFEVTAEEQIVIKGYRMREKSGYDESQNKYVTITQHLIDFAVSSSMNPEDIQTIEYLKVVLDDEEDEFEEGLLFAAYEELDDARRLTNRGVSEAELVPEEIDSFRQSLIATLAALTTLEPLV